MTNFLARAKSYAAGIVASFFILLFFLSALIGRSFFFHFDLLGSYLPQRYFVARSISDGIVPFWCPDRMCGYPIFAEGQAGIFYPPNALNLVLPVWYATNLLIIFHLVFAFWGAYLVLRKELSDISSAVGGIGYVLSGFVIWHISHLSALECAAWLPWALWSIEKSIVSNRSKFLPILFLLFSYLAGHGQTFFIVSFATVAYALLNIFRVSDKPRFLLYIVGLFLLPFFIAAPYFFSQLELVFHSSRYIKTQAAFSWEGSLLPVQLLDLFIPGLTGDPAHADFACPVAAIWEMLLYPGLLIALFVWAVDSKRPRGLLFLGLFFMFFVLSLGKYSLFGEFIARAPFIGKLREPVRWWWAAGLFLSFSAAYGFERVIVDREWKAVKRAGIGVLVTAAVILIGAFVIIPAFSEVKSVHKIGSLLPLQFGLLVAVFVLSVFAVKRSYRGIAWLLFLISIADVGRNIDRTLVLGDPRWLHLPANIAGIAQRPRIFSIFDMTSYSFFGWREDEKKAMERFASGPLTMSLDIPMIWGYKTASAGFSPLLPVWVDEYRDSTNVGVRLDLEMVSSIFLPGEVNIKGWQEVNSGVDGIRIFVNSEPAPYCRILGKVLRVKTKNELFGILNSEKFNLRSEAVVLGGSDKLLDGMSDSSVEGNCEVSESWANGVKLKVRSGGQALFMISETAYPGWQAWVDGEKAQVVTVDGRFLGVPVKSGEHEVLFKFRPTYLWHGVLVSVISILLLLMISRWSFESKTFDARVAKTFLFIVLIIVLFAVLLKIGNWTSSAQECLKSVMRLN